MSKRKSISLLLVITLVLSISITPVNADIPYGDVAGNGKVDVGDAISVLRYVVGLTTLTDLQKQAADVNEDGQINVSDAIIILRFIVGLVDSLPYTPPPITELQVHYIDVGQGDSILIITPEDKTILIDAGDRWDASTVLNYLDHLSITSLDIVVGTHPHADHIGGLINVIETLPVGKVIDSGKAHTTITYNDYLDIIEEKDILFELGRAGQSIDVDQHLSIKILHPGPNTGGYSLNDASVVIKLIHNQVGFLFAGDAEEEAEAEILARGYNLAKINVLKIGHHGSRTSTSQAFLNALSPTSAIIMCGTGNTYGHPHDETLSKLSSAGVDVYRTDISGNIVVISDGISYAIDSNPVTYDPPAPDPDPEPDPEPDPDPAPGKIDINSASYDDLQEIIHIGPSRAEWIIDNRPHSSVDDLINCTGIGPARLQDIKDEGKAYVGTSGEIIYDEAA